MKGASVFGGSIVWGIPVFGGFDAGGSIVWGIPVFGGGSMQGVPVFVGFDAGSSVSGFQSRRFLCITSVSHTELEITAGHRPFSDQNGKPTDQIPICLDMNPIGFLLCPGKSYHARTECPTKTQSLFLALVILFAVPVSRSSPGV